MLHASRRAACLLILAACVSEVAADQPERPEHEGKVVLFGNLHAHSAHSDDVKAAGDDLSPLAAFTYAREHGLDFLAITDHHKGNKEAGHEDTYLRIGPQEYRDSLLEVARSFNTQHAGEFIAVPGIEWGTTATGNHLNLFGIDALPPDTILDAEYDELLAWAAAHADFAQFNHPASWRTAQHRNQAVGNFGENLFATTAAFAQAANATVRTCSVISTVPGGHISGALRHSEAKTHRDVSDKNFREFTRFLNAGLRLAPAANQDTHWRNWGTVTASRTAVWATTPTYEGFVEAVKARRVYATEDDELAVAFQVRYRDAVHWMGESVALTEDETDVELLVRIGQGPGRDTGIATSVLSC